MSIPGDMSDGDLFAKKSPRIALVTGFTGQDGTFLTRLLLDKGYTVLGMTRRISTEPPVRVRGKFSFTDEIKSGQLVLVPGDLKDIKSLLAIFMNHRVDEVYNLAAQSDVHLSFSIPHETYDSNAVGVLNLLTAMDAIAPNTKLYHASTSELFGVNGGTQNENTPFAPASPYGEAKLAAYWSVRNWRNKGHFACNGILFNHESEIRGGDFVTQKIVRAVARRTVDPSFVLELGNIESRRDWGYAGDYVKAMYSMTQLRVSDDYVVATGVTRSIREFLEASLKTVGLSIEWRGLGSFEQGFVDGSVFVRINPKFYRPVEVPDLNGDATKARQSFGWEPTTTFDGLVGLMTENALSQL